jgi:hypothetical protein
MKKAVAGSLITAFLVAGAAVAATTNVVSVNVVGFQKLDVAGGATATYTLLGVPMTKIPAVRGTITGNTSNTISDSTMAWAVNEFATNASGKETYGKSTFFVEITSSNAPLAGRHFYIKNNDETTLTLLSNLGIPDNALTAYSYKIVAANRIRDVFGETNAPSLKGGTSLLDSDLIYFWNGGWQTIYFKTNAPLKNRYVYNGAAADDRVIDRDEGIMVRRLAGYPPTNIVVAGEVSANLQAIIIDGSDFSLIGGMSVIDQAIGNTSLSNVVKGATSLLDGDLLYTWNSVAGSWVTAYFKTNAPLKNKWVSGGVAVDTTLILRAGQGYMILRRGATSSEWDRFSPLQ